MYKYRRDKDKGSFDWNRVVERRWDDQFQLTTMWPSKGYYRFRQNYREENVRLTAVAQEPLFWGAYNMATLVRYDCGISAQALRLNSLTPFIDFDEAAWITQPSGTDVFASMYDNYRVSSVDMDAYFKIDPETLDAPDTAGVGLKFTLGFGFYIDTTAITGPSAAQLKEAVKNGQFPLSYLHFDSNQHNVINDQAHVKVRNLNVLNQWVQDDTGVDVENTGVFTGTFGTSYATVGQPGNILYGYFFVVMIEPPTRVGAFGTPDVNCTILSTFNLTQHSQLSSPVSKVVETTA